MTNKEYHPIARQLLKSLENKERFHHLLITRPISDNSFKECVFWTIKNIKDELTLAAHDDLSKKTIQELINLRLELDFSKAEIFDELSFKNWRAKSVIQKPFLLHNALSRISWVCLLAICKENNREHKSKYVGRNSIPKEVFYKIGNKIGNQSGMTMNLVFANNFNYGEEMAKSITEVMNKMAK